MKFYKFLFMFLLLSFKVWAQSESKTQVLDKAQSYLHSLTNEVDTLLGGKRADDINNKSTFRLIGQERIEAHQKDTQSFSINGVTKIATLVRWQQQASDWLQGKEKQIEQDVENYVSSVTGKNFGNMISKINSSGQNSQKNISKNPWILSFDKNLEYHSIDNFGFFAHLRVRKDFQLGPFFNSFAQEFGWDSDNQWEALGDLAVNFQLSRSVYSTLHQKYFWFINQDDFTTNHSLGLRWLINKNQVVIFDGGIETRVLSNDWFTDFYYLKTVYRQGFSKQRFFTQLTPFINFHKINNFKDSPGLIIALELKI